MHSIKAFSYNIFYSAIASFSSLPFPPSLSDTVNAKSVQTSEAK